MPSGSRLWATHFFCRKSLVCNLAVKGRLSCWRPILYRRTSLLGDTSGITLQSRQGTRSSFWRIHENHCRANLSFLIKTTLFKAFSIWTLGAGGSLPLSVGGSFTHPHNKSNGEVRHLSLFFFSRLANCRIHLVHKPLQSRANNLNVSSLLFLLLRRLGVGCESRSTKGS